MRPRWLLAAGLSVFILSVWGIVNLGEYLSTPAQAPRKADLIVVLGGDGGARSLTGAELYQGGLAPYLLLTGLEEGEKEAVPYYLHWRSQLLQAKGVAATAILFDEKSMNSWQEAQNTLEMMRQKGWRRVLVVSDPPHLRRLDWVWGKTFAGTDKEYLLIAAMPSWWRSRAWWGDERSAKFVVNELGKLIYYRLKYSF